MEVKLFEVRDRATFIPVMAVRLFVDPITILGTYKRRVMDGVRHESELYLLRRAGYGIEHITGDQNLEPYVILANLQGGGRAEYDVYGWSNRTMQVAHNTIVQHWDKMCSGMVVDVEFLLNETNEPKVSERLTAPI